MLLIFILLILASRCLQLLVYLGSNHLAILLFIGLLLLLLLGGPPSELSGLHSLLGLLLSFERGVLGFEEVKNLLLSEGVLCLTLLGLGQKLLSVDYSIAVVCVHRYPLLRQRQLAFSLLTICRQMTATLDQTLHTLQKH